MRIIFFDTETTGNMGEDRLCQLAIKERGVAEPILNALYTPPVPISIESMAVHHITPKMLKDRPLFVDSPEYREVKALFEAEDTLAVAHNVTFDVSMLMREGISVRNPVCTYKLASHLDPNDLISKYTLQYLRYLLDLDIAGEVVAHDAFGDVVVLEALFERLLAKMAKTHSGEELALEEMRTVSARPLLFTTIRFGKHKGRKIADIARTDRDYVEWLLRSKRETPGEEDWIYTLEYFLSN
jgi:DNA polymerase III epsilon subunit-like protein